MKKNLVIDGLGYNNTKTYILYSVFINSKYKVTIIDKNYI